MMRWKLVVILTAALTVLVSLAYVILSPPVYEAKTQLKIGGYTTNNTKQLFESVNSLKAYINFKYDLSNDYSRNPAESYLESVSIPDKNAAYISITANGPSGEEAREILSEAVDEILARHRILYDSVLETTEKQIAGIEKQIYYYTENALPRMESELETLQNLQADRINRNNQTLQINLEIDYLLDEIISGKASAINELVGITIPDLETKSTELKKNMKAPFLEMTSIVGDISVPENPVKPKKLQILAIALSAGIIPGIILALFLEFLNSKKNRRINNAPVKQ